MTHVVNRGTRALLRSGIHDLASATTAVLAVTGRRSGRRYEIPVNYLRDGDTLTLTSLRRRTWWRNLRGGAPVSVLLDGSERTGQATVVEAFPVEIEAAIAALSARAPGPSLSPAAIADLATRTVLVRVTLDPMTEAPAPPLRGRALARRWFAATTAGELCGFAVPALAGAVLVAAGAPALVVAPALVAAGAVEGLVLGLAQASALRRALPSIRTADWAGATALAAAVAWALGLVPSVLGDRLTELPVAVLAAGGALLGTALLLTMGLLQQRVLKPHVARSGRWVAITAAGWAAGLAVFTAISSPLWTAGQPVLLVAAIGVLAGAAMAATVGAVTGAGLSRLLRGR